MSDKWETVGKPSKPSKGSPKGKSNGTKKSVPKPMPKLEDVLPAGSLQSMYTDYEPPVQAPTKVEKKAEPKSKGDNKKQAKKEPAPVKPKAPANLAEAVKMNLRVDDIKHLIESGQGKFPDSPLLWLRDLAAYLNLKLVYDNQTSEWGLFDGAPLNALSQNMKKAIYAMVQGIPDSMKETYLETCISNTAHDLAKNLNVTGWMVLTQVMSDVGPSLITSNIPRLVELRNSYQNRPIIGQAILWSVGQAGKKDLHVGVKIWMEIMLPLISMKNYTRFVIEYISALITTHNITEKTVLSKPVMDLNNFATLQDTVFQVSSQINKDLGKQLREVYPRLRAAALAGCKNHEIFPTVMEKMKHMSVAEQVEDCLDILAKCLVATPAALVHWHKLYTSHLTQSGQLLEYLNANWDQYKSAATPNFEETLNAFQDYNISATHKEEVIRCRDECGEILAKLSKGRGAWFPWKTVSFLLLIGTAAIINLDVQKNGSFSRSHAGYFLKDIGQYDSVVGLYSRGNKVYLDGYNWSEKNLPIYYDQAREVVGPTLDTAVDSAKAAGTFMHLKGGEAYTVLCKASGDAYATMQVKGGELYSAVREGVSSLEEQYPGIKKNAGLYLNSAQEYARGAGNRLVSACQDLAAGKVDWNEVKDNLIKKMEETQGAVVKGVHWARQQIDQFVK